MSVYDFLFFDLIDERYLFKEFQKQTMTAASFEHYHQIIWCSGKMARTYPEMEKE